MKNNLLKLKDLPKEGVFTNNYGIYDSEGYLVNVAAKIYEDSLKYAKGKNVIYYTEKFDLESLKTFNSPLIAKQLVNCSYTLIDKPKFMFFADEMRKLNKIYFNDGLLPWLINNDDPIFKNTLLDKYLTLPRKTVKDTSDLEFSVIYLFNDSLYSAFLEFHDEDLYTVAIVCPSCLKDKGKDLNEIISKTKEYFEHWLYGFVTLDILYSPEQDLFFIKDVRIGVNPITFNLIIDIFTPLHVIFTAENVLNLDYDIKAGYLIKKKGKGNKYQVPENIEETSYRFFYILDENTVECNENKELGLYLQNYKSYEELISIIDTEAVLDAALQDFQEIKYNKEYVSKTLNLLRILTEQ